MDLTGMHSLFRQFAQQMGMQNTRAILPEQIDMCINTSITDTVNQLISQNISTTNDRVITDNSKLGQINAFSTLYKVREVTLLPTDWNENDKPPVVVDPDLETDNSPDNGEIASRTKVIVRPFQSGKESYITRLYSKIEDLIDVHKNYTDIPSNNINIPKFEYLFIIDLSINYALSDDKITNYFPVRLIDDAYLADTLNDFILKPRVRTPISVIYNNQIDLYIDESTNMNGITPNILRVSYLKKPNKVKYNKDFGEPNVDCDLPEYLHVDIIKHAVDLWRIAVSGSLHASQQQEQAQQQEVARNNYRNEGNQR